MIFDRADFNLSLKLFTNMADKVAKICMDICRKLKKSIALNIMEG
jgi:hypothetical protein